MPEPARTVRRAVAAALLSLVACLVVAELGLRAFLPYTVATIGHRAAPNAARYGWGYAPGEPIRIRDPDTGEVYAAPANNHGWRDRDRSFAKPPGTYRILVLGDSVTFGAVVPADRTYTRILEDRLRAAGYRAEVLNMAYGAWGTDQQLEALRHEGLRYSPDLIVLQFTPNDLKDNLSHRSRPTQKPFYYTVARDGSARRHENPAFDLDPAPATWRGRAARVLSRLEIGRRLVGAVRVLRDRGAPAYRASAVQLEQLVTAVPEVAGTTLVPFLEARLDRGLDRSAIENEIERAGLADREAAILRILENRFFHESWSKALYAPAPQDPESEAWRLYFALVREIAREARAAGARLALLSTNDESKYRWEREWFRIDPDPVYRAHFLSATRLLEAFARREGIGWVPPPADGARMRNDPHPSIEGNRKLAEALYEYLMTHHALALDASRDAAGTS